MSAINTAASAFSNAFDNIATVVPFQSEWKNGTGYFDHLVRAGDVGFDESGIATCTDDYGRRMIIVRSRFGNIVIFARYKGEDNQVFTWNAPSAIEAFTGFGGSLTGEQIRQLTGDPKWPTLDPHFGARLEILFD